jgi:hypothetical protein
MIHSKMASTMQTPNSIFSEAERRSNKSTMMGLVQPGPRTRIFGSDGTSPHLVFARAPRDLDLRGQSCARRTTRTTVQTPWTSRYACVRRWASQLVSAAGGIEVKLAHQCKQ